jgi:glycosyltransferase involved in cell wall biosynthesis
VRIVHVLTETRGGGSTQALALARAATARGDSVAFAAPEPPGEDVEWIELGSSRGGRARSALRSADVAHFHGVRAGLLAAMSGRAAAVLTTHGLHALRRSTGIRRLGARVVTKRALRLADAVVCVSGADADALLALDAACAGRLRLILNGVAPAALPSETERAACRKRLGVPADVPLVVFAGRLTEQKDPLLAVETARVARAALPELVLVVAGGGPLAGAVRAHESEGLRVVGHRTDLDAVLVAADVVLNTSRWEGLSLVLLEALWRGVPVVATDASGNAEAVGDAGLVVRPDPEELARALVHVLRTRDVRAELAGRARRRAEELFDERRMLEATLRLYDELVGAPSAASLRPPS